MRRWHSPMCWRSRRSCSSPPFWTGRSQERRWFRMTTFPKPAPPEEFDVYNNGTWGGNSGSASAVPGGFPNPFDGNFHVWRMDWPSDTEVQFFIDDIPCGNSSWGSGNGVFTNTNMTAQGNGASWPYTMANTGGL